MTKKRFFRHIKNSKIVRYLHVKHAVKSCAFYAKKIRVIFRPAFSPVWFFYWTFNKEVARTSRF